MTVSEITQKVQPGASETERTALAIRIAHWTRERLLAPIGRQNPGTGRHRRYNDDAVVDVQVLNAMANAGLQAEPMRETMRLAIFLVREARRTGEWREKAKQGINIYLEIDRFPGGQLAAYIPPDRERMLPSAVESATIINLTKLFAVLEPPTATLTLTGDPPIVSVTTKKGE